MRKAWMLMLLLAGAVGAPAQGEGSCTLKCVRWWLFSCAKTDVNCSGDLTCRNGDCGSLDALASCRRSETGNWSVILDCGRSTTDAAAPQWQISYQRPGEQALVTLASGPGPWGSSADPSAASFDPASELVIRVCPGKNRTGADEREVEEPPLDLSAGVAPDLAPGFAVGTVELVEGRLRIHLLTYESATDRATLEKALADLLEVPAQRPAPFWFTVLWKNGRAEGLALGL